MIEQAVLTRVSDLFGLDWPVTLDDLTNTFFEGAALGNPKAQRGHSKEKRSDCPLVTLGLVLDGSGFVRRSQTFDGAVSEGTTRDPANARPARSSVRTADPRVPDMGMYLLRERR